jgi:MFS superfamily sulfate permease-like transporter
MILCGRIHKTPFPAQPMKAVGAAATAQATQIAITPGVVFGAGLATGLIWLLVGAIGLAERLGRWVSQPVVQGVMLGLALMALLASVRRFPSLFVVLLLEMGWTAFERPEALSALSGIGLDWRWPTFTWPAISAHELLLGTVLLALLQALLTLGNAIVGIRAENNRLLPHRTAASRIAASRCPPAA